MKLPVEYTYTDDKDANIIIGISWCGIHIKYYYYFRREFGFTAGRGLYDNDLNNIVANLKKEHGGKQLDLDMWITSLEEKLNE